MDCRKRLALVGHHGQFVPAFDATAVNVALSAIREDLGGGSPSSNGFPTRTC